MGIDYDSKLILGWEVNRDKVLELLAKHEVGSCGGAEHQCFCGDDCWPNRAALPLQIELTFVQCSPYFDCRQDDLRVFLTLDCDGDGTSLAELQRLINAVDWDAARKIAVELGAADAPATVFSAAHIW